MTAEDFAANGSRADEKEDGDMTLSEKILMLRKQKGWSQEELAEQLGVSRQVGSKVGERDESSGFEPYS